MVQSSMASRTEHETPSAANEDAATVVAMPSSVTARPQGHPAVAFGRVGVLLVNLGTPDSPGFWDVRRYLDEFLSDPRVVELPRLLWQPILKGIILNTRPQKTKQAYAKIWKADTNESPLRYYTRMQADALQERLDPDGRRVIVDWAMRYGQPGIPTMMDSLQKRGCDRILVFALYPQYSATTTATAYDRAFKAMREMRWQPGVRTVGAYHDEPTYIEALAKGVETGLAGLDFEPEVILCSFHGLPRVSLDKGDPYHCQCMKTARLLRERLGIAEERFRTTFQSRFGAQEWLKPYTDDTLEELGEAGVKRIAVLTPGFVSDCVETLEEIAIEGKKTFLEAGGTHFAALPCLNDSAEGLEVIETVCRRELGGWVD